MQYRATPTRQVFDTPLGWKVVDDVGNFVCECWDETIANRIALALTLLEEQEPTRNDAARLPKAQSIGLSLLIATEVLAHFSLDAVRAKSLQNLARWKARGTWGPAYEEWHALLTRADDATLRNVMTGLEENSVRLRQSPPYIGLLSREVLAECIAKWWPSNSHE